VPPTTNGALKRPPEGATYFVDVLINTKTFFVSKRFTSLGEAIREHGVGSPLAKALTLTAGTAGRGNGASIIVTVGTPDTSQASFQAAYDVLRAKDIDTLTPITPDFTIAQDAFAHVTEMTSDAGRKERMLFWGPAVGTLVGDSSTAGTVLFQAATFRSRIAVLVYPWFKSNTQDTAGVIAEEELDGAFAAAAVVGRVASLPDRATPVTTKRINGITELGKPGTLELDEATMDILGGDGVLVITPRFGNFIVRDGRTTDNTTTENAEISIVLTEFFLRKTLRVQFESFKGQKLLPALLIQIERRTQRILELFLKQGLISFFDPETINADQDPDDLTKVIVRFEYRPTFPVRIIEFRYAFDLRVPAATPVVA